MTPLLRIRRVEPRGGFVARLTLTDGRLVERDLEGLLRGPVFAPLRADRLRIRRMRIRQGTLTRPGDLDLDPDVLIWGSAPPEGDGTPPPRLSFHAEA